MLPQVTSFTISGVERQNGGTVCYVNFRAKRCKSIHASGIVIIAVGEETGSGNLQSKSHRGTFCCPNRHIHHVNSIFTVGSTPLFALFLPRRSLFRLEYLSKLRNNLAF